MAKKKKTLGKGLDSLIPDVYDENFDETSSKSLEDILDDDELIEEKDIIDEDLSKEVSEKSDEDHNNEDLTKENLEIANKEDENKKLNKIIDYSKPSTETLVDSSLENNEEKNLNLNEIAINQELTDKVIEEVKKNPRITLWSVRSAAVFRYLRKTEPEFSISKEASKLIDEAVSSKYPDIWKLFDI
ncbi:MAG: AAA family ATPase [Methanobacteriaceae archaeon]|nr:AAA family ATPase [Methanobacteriaceae archaeon]